MKRLIAASISVIICLGAFTLSQAPAQGQSVCESNLNVFYFETAWEDLEVGIDNPTETIQTGGLVVEFTLNGHWHGWWFDTTVPADSLAHWSARFPGIITVLSVSACDSIEDVQGIVEAPDPVAKSVKQKNKAH